MSDQRNIMQRLREETAELHKQAESKPFEQAQVRGTIPRELYVAGLAQRYLVHRALDAELFVLARQRRLAGVLHERQMQSGHARADLEHFGVDVEIVSPGRAAQQLIDLCGRLGREAPTALLGVHYVFEGSKNGARYIARALGPALGLKPGGPGMRYLDPHGEQQRPLWEAFKQAMDAVGFDAAEMAAMVAAARETFACVARLDDEIWLGAREMATVA